MTNSKINRRRFVEDRQLWQRERSVFRRSCRARAVGKDSPNDTLQIGCIGVGRMGLGDMKECMSQGMRSESSARIVAVCDLDRQRGQHAKRGAESFYQSRNAASTSATVYGDYRELLEREDIDAVTISTPDHWHALAAIAAASAGKSIYLQKPLTFTIGEGRKLVDAVRRGGVVLQTGSQQRSNETFRHACECVRNGRLGKLRSIIVTLPTDSGFGKPTPMPVPKGLNYDMWLGPTLKRYYTEHRVHPQSGYSRPGWLQIETYCRGMITGWGSHMFDIAQWGHGSDDTGPVEMTATAEFPRRGLFNVHTTFRAEGRYADGVTLVAQSGSPAGVRFEGDQGWIDVGRSHLKAEPGDVLRDETGQTEQQLERSSNHMLNFLCCVRLRDEPICPVEVGHRSNSICVMTHIAMKLGRKLRWEPFAERFVDDEQANSMLDYVHREPWTV